MLTQSYYYTEQAERRKSVYGGLGLKTKDHSTFLVAEPTEVASKSYGSPNKYVGIRILDKQTGIIHASIKHAMADSGLARSTIVKNCYKESGRFEFVGIEVDKTPKPGVRIRDKATGIEYPSATECACATGLSRKIIYQMISNGGRFERVRVG